jgi:hypothetical protein
MNVRFLPGEFRFIWQAAMLSARRTWVGTGLPAASPVLVMTVSPSQGMAPLRAESYHDNSTRVARVDETLETNAAMMGMPRAQA